MGDTGPCGPSSEIFWDLGPTPTATGGGPADRDHDRYVEIWNLVFMSTTSGPTAQVPLPKPSIDTGAGLERMPAGRSRASTSIFDIDVFAPLIAAAEQVTGATLRRPSPRPTCRCGSSPTTPAP